MDHTETCLSPSVKKYFLLTLDEEDSSVLKETFIINKIEIDFQKILETINPVGNVNESEAAVNLVPVLRRIHEEFLDQSLDLECDDVSCHVRWTSQPDHLRWCWNLLRGKTDEDSLQLLLVLTPLLERSLGNIVSSLSPTIKVPALLKDLLLMPELSHLLGGQAILVMRK